jgi:hypothetical protein
MASYDPKRPRRAVSEEEPAPVDALIDLAAHDSTSTSQASTRVVTAVTTDEPPADGRPPGLDVTATPGTPAVEGPHGDDGTARVVLALIGLGAVAAVGAVVVLSRRRR